MTYPWYTTVSGDSLEQGDIFEACPVFYPPDNLADIPLVEATFIRERRNIIVLSQTCDMVEGREKITEALLCPLWLRAEFTEGFLSTSKGLEEARRGNMPAFHVIAACALPGQNREVRVVDFRRVYSLPLSFLRRRATVSPDRLRLLPPYREHLSQAFARFFMRVGLPSDISLFRQRVNAPSGKQGKINICRTVPFLCSVVVGEWMLGFTRQDSSLSPALRLISMPLPVWDHDFSR